ncbi:hypothetical protein BGY98DRAFT_649894, partial [Russula aff. rugulosa BPL654]
RFGKVDITSLPEPPLATLVAAWIRGTQLRCTLRLCHSSYEQLSYNSSNLLASSSSAIITRPLLPTPLSLMLSCIPVPSSRALLHITVSILCFLGLATSRPTQNITIEVPNGTTSHGEPNTFCTPATWSDIARYLLLNYVAHGATVVSYPGEPAFDVFVCVVTAILFPTFGVIRALNFIIRIRF